LCLRPFWRDAAKILTLAYFSAPSETQSPSTC
jgi:hypothetical protein